MSENPNPASAGTPPPETAPTEPPASSAPTTDWPVLDESAPSEAAESGPPPSDTSTAATSTAADQSSLAAPRGLSYAVDIVFCVDVTGSMTPIIDQVKANALRFYDDVQSNLTTKGKNVDQLRVRVIGFRDFVADGAAALDESPFFTLPDDRADFSAFVNGLVAEGGGDAPESGLEAVALAIDSSWTTTGDRRRQVIVVWTDQPAQPLNPSVLPPDIGTRVPADFSALTDAWEDEQGRMGSSSKRLILFAPDGPGWSDISGVWENVVHHPSQAGGGLSEVDYGTIIDSIGNSV
ncbi:MAG TPA: vWA domain-containing protein [Propionibacteriaceae bacterium]|nr:vWA domain-containing protein [Propionibacteriaceae bacterium]